jgi:hypothetical protein
MKPPKVLYPRPRPMRGAKEVEVLMCRSGVPQGNVRCVLSSEVRSTLNLPPVYPAHEKTTN